MIFLFLFLFGLCVGSYLNVVLFRLQTGESSYAGRSHCDACGYQLAWYDNIPVVSYLFLKGYCRKCHVSLSPQHLIIECITGGVFVLAGLLFPWQEGSLASGLTLVWLLGVLSYSILITVYDWEHMEIPTVFLWGINAITIVYIGLFAWLDPTWTEYFPHSPLSSFIGALIGGGFFWLLVYWSRETWMGWGDVWLGTWGGMVVGVALTQVFITLSFTYGAIIGIGLLLRHKKTLKAQIPFAPYILFGAVTVLVMEKYFPEVLAFLSPWFPGIL